MTLRSISSTIAAYFDYEIWQMDVKTAFLHGNLTEDVYMIQPKGFVDPTSASKLCKLKRSIYGLRQVSVSKPADLGLGVPNCASKVDGNSRQGTQCLPRFGPSLWR